MLMHGFFVIVLQLSVYFLAFFSFFFLKKEKSDISVTRFHCISKAIHDKGMTAV
jgi:hypothetical protein